MVPNCLSSTYLGSGRCQFSVWAPAIKQVAVHVVSPEDRLITLLKNDQGYHEAIIEDLEPGYLYYYLLDQKRERPDPASRFQPEGVHGPSQIVDPYYCWGDQGWSGIPLTEYIIYELHVGTFTRCGTFDAIIPYIDELKGLGVTAIELMPVGQFPGQRNWGYDGVYPFAVQESYGGPKSLKRLINVCHQKGIAVVLDVIYNHLGPEGNYLADFGPYFTDRYRTPWGAALNFDGPYSDGVRRYFIENAIYWLTDFHIDALRLDALHAIADNSSYPFLAELASVFHQQAVGLKRRAYLIGESAANDARIIRATEKGGYGLDAQWNDDFHHSLHTLLTGERTGYYQDFDKLDNLVKALQDGFVYTGQYSPYRQHRHGSSSQDIPAYRFVVFNQNHDQVGNRAHGERLSQLVSFEALKLAAGVTILSPFIPLLFMGEEYGETAPFLYFVSHSEPSLIRAVRKGRQEEFAAFQWRGEIPDPQDETTFLRTKLDHKLHDNGEHQILLALYRELIRLRKETPALSHLSKEKMAVIGYEKEKVIFIHRWLEESEVIIVFNFNNENVPLVLPFSSGFWQKQLDSADKQWHGKGSCIGERFDSRGEVTITLTPLAFTLFIKERPTRLG